MISNISANMYQYALKEYSWREAFVQNFVWMHITPDLALKEIMFDISRTDWPDYPLYDCLNKQICVGVQLESSVR